jgi:excinuclease ABC subunit C
MAINLTTIPHKPGVYLFKNKSGDLLYIGKAINLKNRVSSYFQKSSALTPHKKLMVNQIKKIEFIITSSETEALLLESTLIKKNQPPYNIDLKDDKNFLYIKITVDEEFPRIFAVRQINKDKAKYFGPSTSAGAVRGTLRFLRKLFPHRNFSKDVSSHHLQNLLTRYPQLFGPTDPAEYRHNINQIVRFLKGQLTDIVTDLKKRMVRASAHKRFEQAAELRDKIRLLRQVVEKQKIISPRRENQDIISLSHDEHNAAINLFNVRNGALINKQNFLLRNVAGQNDAEIVEAFISQYYPRATDIPKQIIIAESLANQHLLEQAFHFKIIIAKKGTKRQYLNLGRENAESFLDAQKASWQQDQTRSAQALQQLTNTLGLPHIPERIETYDISNIQGAHAVGSMIVFSRGLPDKKWYRKFIIKTVKGANDPAMLAEVLKRRFARTKTTPRAWPKPDLIVLDGGKGQLGPALRLIPHSIPTIALAKKQEDIYLPGRKKPLNFPSTSAAFYLMQRMRDEAHRFAITFYRQTHKKSWQRSLLDDIPGLGPKTKKALLKEFGSIAELQKASQEKLTQIVGHHLAHAIKEYI